MKPATEVSGLCGLPESCRSPSVARPCRRKHPNLPAPPVGREARRAKGQRSGPLCVPGGRRVPARGQPEGQGHVGADDPCRDVHGPSRGQRAWSQAGLFPHYSAGFELVGSQESMLAGSTGDVGHQHGAQRSGVGSQLGASLPRLPSLQQPGLPSEARSGSSPVEAHCVPALQQEGARSPLRGSQLRQPQRSQLV